MLTPRFPIAPFLFFALLLGLAFTACQRENMEEPASNAEAAGRTAQTKGRLCKASVTTKGSGNSAAAGSPDISAGDKAYIVQMYRESKIRLQNKAGAETVHLKVSGIRYAVAPGASVEVPVSPLYLTAINILEKNGMASSWDGSQSLVWSNLKYRIVKEDTPGHYRIEVDE